MSSSVSSGARDDDEEEDDIVNDILRELNEPSIVPAPADRNADRLPFNPKRVSADTLLRYAREYRNHEPLLAQVMIELRTRDLSTCHSEVRSLQGRWEYLVRLAKPAKWPDSAIEREERAFQGRCFQCGDQGMLAFFGYHVGKTRGLLMPVRHQILDYIYKGPLPTVNDEPYTLSWGEPCSPKRLRRMASMLSYLARNAKANHNADYQDALAEWEADLRYLKSMYFRPHDNPDHDWEWPSIDTF